MASRQKRMGDRAERSGLAELRVLAADLLVPGADREFGAGRAADVGDLKVFPDVAVQVRRRAHIGQAIHTAAADAVVQAVNRQVPLGLGMVPVMGARRPSVRWLAACRRWPITIAAGDLVVTGSAVRAVDHARDEQTGILRHRRIAVVCRLGRPEVYVSPIEAWLHAYRQAIGLAPDSGDAPGAAGSGSVTVTRA